MKRTVPLVITFLTGLLPRRLVLRPARAVRRARAEAARLVRDRVGVHDAARRRQPRPVALRKVVRGTTGMVAQRGAASELARHAHRRRHRVRRGSAARSTCSRRSCSSTRTRSCLCRARCSRSWRSSSRRPHTERSGRRNTVATLLLVSAVIVMLGRVPIGAAISQFFPAAQEWIMDIPQLAAKRGIQIGAALGAVSMSLRIMLGIERSYLS